MTQASNSAKESILTKSIQWDSSLPKLLEGNERDRLLSYLNERFGILQKNFTPFSILSYSRQSFLLKNVDNQCPILPKDHLIRAGLPFLRDVAGHLKPTTAFIQRFGHLAKTNVINLTFSELKKLCSKGEISLKNENAIKLSDGYIIIKHLDYFVGVALFLKENNRLLCRLPKALKQALSK